MRGRKSERISEIIRLLEKENGASIKRLAEAFNVSEMTIRRDLETLQERNVVTVVHGAAIFNGYADNNKKYELHHEKDKMANEKMRIGKKAVSLIEPNDVIIIDTGTTAEYIAKMLPDDLPVTVVCYTANTLVELYKKPLVQIIFAGGYYHHNAQMFASPEGIQLINRTCATKAFIAAAGVCKRLGVTCVNQYEIETKHAALGSARSKILVMDSTKFDKIRPAHFADLSDFDVMITDSRISPEWQEYIEDMGITLLIA